MRVCPLHWRQATPDAIGLFVLDGPLSARFAHWAGLAKDQELAALDHRFIEEKFRLFASASSTLHPVRWTDHFPDSHAAAARSSSAGAVDVSAQATPRADGLELIAHSWPANVP